MMSEPEIPTQEELEFSIKYTCRNPRCKNPEKLISLEDNSAKVSVRGDNVYICLNCMIEEIGSSSSVVELDEEDTTATHSVRQIVQFDKSLDAEANYSEPVFEILGVSDDPAKREQLKKNFTDYAMKIIKSLGRIDE